MEYDCPGECVVLNRTVVYCDWNFNNLCGSHLQTAHSIPFANSLEKTAFYPRSAASIAATSLTDVAAFISKRNYPTYAFMINLNNCLSTSFILPTDMLAYEHRRISGRHFSPPQRSEKRSQATDVLVSCWFHVFFLFSWLVRPREQQ